MSEYATLTYQVTGRIARITFNRPAQGNSITRDTPVDLAHAVERADLDPRVHVIVVSGRGKGFCGGYDLAAFAENSRDAGGGETGTVLDAAVQLANHDPTGTWDPMLDYAMMSRFNRGFASLLHANKPTVAKVHGFCVAGGTDIALYADQIVIADDAKIGYPPTRVWGVPAAGMWAHRLGDQRAKRLLLTGDCLSGSEAADWGLAVESAPADQLDERTEVLLERIAAMPINQLIMVKLALNSALMQQGVATSGMVSTVFDGISRHTTRGLRLPAARRRRRLPSGRPRARRRAVRRRRPEHQQGLRTRHDMAYRRTAAVQERLDATRERILGAAHDVVAERGFAGCSVAVVAEAARGRDRQRLPPLPRQGRPTGRGLPHLDAARGGRRRRGQRGPAARSSNASPASSTPSPRRAFRSPRLAYALIAEPVDPQVEAQRLVYRAAYRDLIARLIEHAVAAGELPYQDAQVSAAGVVGAMAEALVVPLHDGASGGSEPHVVPALTDFILRSLGAFRAHP